MVVVGGGPGGLLAAHFLAAHHGCKVELFDKRQHPGPIPIPEGDADDDDRAFAIALNSRGADAVAAGGLDISQFTGMAGAGAGAGACGNDGEEVEGESRPMLRASQRTLPEPLASLTTLIKLPCLPVQARICAR